MQTPVDWLTKYLRLTNYLGAAQLYLKDNYLLEEELKPEHVKSRILGHWGTVPGLNFIWACLNYNIYKYKRETLAVVGPGHGYPAVQANLFADGTIGEFFPEYNINSANPEHRKNAFGKIIRDFSWPGGFPSHSNPATPGCILEGGELGYALATSFGAVFDNPELVVACIVGDGEAETGPTATAWHSNKFLNPITSGAVLPIVHINGYKISGPTIYGTMSDAELINLFNGYGYKPIVVSGDMLFEPMLAAVGAAYETINHIQTEARKSGNPGQPKWPVILLRSPKGWFGPDPIEEDKPIVGSFRSHGIPLEHPKTDSHEFNILKKWLESYKVKELVNDDYTLQDDTLDYVPTGDMRMGMNLHARGINTKDLNLPNIEDYRIDTGEKGSKSGSSTNVLSKYMRDIFRNNESNKNFRLFCPDETESNKLQPIFEVTNRAYLWPTTWHDENLSPDGRVMEMLSEHTLQGWFQGYTLTGRHGILVTYEAFAEIISSMVDQYSKFIRHASQMDWRVDVPSLNFLLTSLTWRQDHNGFSHQNPSFISSVLNDQGNFISVYFPPDGNSMLAIGEEVFKSKNKINVIVAGKRPIPQWLSLEEARRQVKEDIQVWDFASDENPDVILTGCGDYPTREIMGARKLLKTLIPEIRVRVVNVTELTCFGIGDHSCECNISDIRFDEVFTNNRAIIFNYHGYPEDIKSLIFNHYAAPRFRIHGYTEKGTTTTPFDMLIQNEVSRYNLAIEAIHFASVHNEIVASKSEHVIAQLREIIEHHKQYIRETGVDIEDVDNFDFKI